MRVVDIGRTDRGQTHRLRPPDRVVPLELSFEEVYRRHAEPLLRYCYARLGNVEQAQDATSQVFLKAFAAWSAYRGEGVTAWLFAIARNLTTDFLRHQRSDIDVATCKTLSSMVKQPLRS